MGTLRATFGKNKNHQGRVVTAACKAGTTDGALRTFLNQGIKLLCQNGCGVIAPIVEVTGVEESKGRTVYFVNLSCSHSRSLELARTMKNAGPDVPIWIEQIDNAAAEDAVQEVRNAELGEDRELTLEELLAVPTEIEAA